MEKTEQREEIVEDTVKGNMRGERERSLGKVKEQVGEELGTYLASASL